MEFAEVAKIKEGGVCPCCGRHAIQISRGIEVGNIFQLGTKYTKTMGMQYVDKDGNLQYPIMGCYGIGIGRLAASVCEVRRDEYGAICQFPLHRGRFIFAVCVRMIRLSKRRPIKSTRASEKRGGNDL